MFDSIRKLCPRPVVETDDEQVEEVENEGELAGRKAEVIVDYSMMHPVVPLLWCLLCVMSIAAAILHRPK